MRANRGLKSPLIKLLALGIVGATTIPLVVLGCGSSHKSEVATTAPATETKDTTLPADPEDALYEQFKTGRYQINAAVDAIGEAVKIAKPMSMSAGGSAGEALTEVSDMLDDAGSSLVEHNDDPPSLEDFKKDFPAQDEERLKSIAAASEALRTLRDAQGTVGDLEANVPADFKADLLKLDDGIGEATDALEEAIKAMGGKVPPDEDDPPSPAPTAPKK